MTGTRPRTTSLAVTDPHATDGFAARIQALFKEAHRRRRRRRRRLAYVLISALSVVAVVLGLATGTPHGPLARHGTARPAGTGAPGFTLPAAKVAWVDYDGQVHVGDVATLSQRVVATVPALAGIGSLVQAGGRLYAGGSSIIRQVDMATVSVRSPLHHGFATSRAAFSPDGSRLAVFARTAGLDPLRDNRSELGLADTRTGAVRLVRGATLDTPEDAGWALWLPGGTRTRLLLAGALNDSYAVDATTYAARPFFFPGNPDHDIMDTPDVNFSVTLMAGSG